MAQFEAVEIGARIKKARNECGLTQEQLADMATGFSKRSLQDYENGVTIPYKHLVEISRLLKKQPEWFLHGDPEDTTDAVRQAIREEMAEAKALLEALSSRLESVEHRLDEGNG